MHSHERQSTCEGSEKAWNDSRYQGFLLDLILEIVAMVSAYNVARLAAHLHRLNEMKQCVVQAFQRDKAEQAGIAKEKWVHGVDMVRGEALEMRLLMFLGPHIDIFKT